MTEKHRVIQKGQLPRWLRQPEHSTAISTPAAQPDVLHPLTFVAGKANADVSTPVAELISQVSAGERFPDNDIGEE